jgi:hypothetical protein
MVRMLAGYDGLCGTQGNAIGRGARGGALDEDDRLAESRIGAGRVGLAAVRRRLEVSAAPEDIPYTNADPPAADPARRVDLAQAPAVVVASERMDENPRWRLLAPVSNRPTDHQPD